MRTDAIGNANCDSNGDDNSYCNPYRDCNGNGKLYAQSDAYTALSAFAEVASDSRAETIEIFATAKISNLLRRSFARR